MIEPSLAALSKQPSNWFTHATASYSFWYQGNVIEAVREADEAVKLNPTNAALLINLALLKQKLCAYPDALNIYARAEKLVPDNWVPPLGIARCHILCGDDASGHKELLVMSRQNNRNFSWYYMVAKTALEINDLNLAEKTVSKVMAVTSATQEERAAAENLLFFVLLRADKLEKAKSLQEHIFSSNHPGDPELFVRAASQLLSPNDSAFAKIILKCAIDNLTSVQDNNAFLKLGRVFESKAVDPACNSTNRASFIESAQAAYARGLALIPTSPDCHFALAGLLSKKGLLVDAADELQKTLSHDQSDIISPLLLSKISNSENSKPEKSTQQNLSSLNLSWVKFNVDGLTCSCKLWKIHIVMRKIKGVAFLSTPPKKPFQGLVLVDQSQISAQDVISQFNQNVSSDPQTKDTPIKLEMVSEEPVTTLDGAFNIVEEIKFGPVLSFPKSPIEYLNRFKEINPIKISETQSISNWNAPLDPFEMSSKQ